MTPDRSPNGKTAALLALVALAGALWTASPTGSAAQAPAETRTEESLRKLLDVFEARYESACVRMNEASWRAAVGSPGADSAQLEAARKDLAVVYADPELNRAINTWAQRKTVTRDPSLTRRVDLWRRTRVSADVELKPEIFTLTQRLAARLRHHRFMLDGRQIGRSEIERLIATSPDRATRKKAWLAAAAFAGEMNKDVRKLIRMRAVEAQSTNERYFHHVVYSARGVDAYWAHGMMEQVARRTRPRHQQILDSLRATLRQERLEPWDLEYALMKRTSERGLDEAIRTAFPANGALPAARRLLEALGFDPNMPEMASIRADGAELGDGGTFSLGIRIPGDIRLVADGMATTGGPRYYEAVFREYGRALQSAFNRQGAPMLKGYECVSGSRNEVYAQGLAEAMGGFVRDPVFLEKYLGMDRKWIGPFLEDEKDRAIVRLRELLLNMGAEFAFYVNPDADLDERYRLLQSRSMGTDAGEQIPVRWPARLELVTRPATDLDQLLALTIAPEVHTRLREAFGADRLGSGKAAAWLIEHCYADGELVELQMRLADSIRGGMDFDPYLDSLGATRPTAAKP